MNQAPALSVVIPTFNNVEVLGRCLESWERLAPEAPIEVIVVEDGCRDRTAVYLEQRAVATPWARARFRWIHENNVHELRATNRGLSEARAPLIMSWQDDMFLQKDWLVPELLLTFDRYPELGLLCLSRGLLCHPSDEPIRTWDDLIDFRRLQSTIGPFPLNWFRLQEVDAVIRPWVVRRTCLERVGLLDEAFVPTGWDEADLAFRIRRAGWCVATHGYERVGAYVHLGSSTLTKFGLSLEQDLRNGLLFHERWDETISREPGRTRRTWWRKPPAAGWTSTVRQAWNVLLPWRRKAIPAGKGPHP